MREEIDRINRVLSTTYYYSSQKAGAIRQWLRSVLGRLEQFKCENSMLLKEAMTLLELALWKAKLLDKKEEGHYFGEKQPTTRAKIDDETARRELRITSGASDVIMNVLSFLV